MKCPICGADEKIHKCEVLSKTIKNKGIAVTIEKDGATIIIGPYEKVQELLSVLPRELIQSVKGTICF